jgi:hypothetical protein
MRGGTIGILYFYSIPFYGPRHSLSLALLRLFCFVFSSYMMESFNRVKEFVVTLMIRCAASLLAVYYTYKLQKDHTY